MCSEEFTGRKEQEWHSSLGTLIHSQRIPNSLSAIDTRDFIMPRHGVQRGMISLVIFFFVFLRLLFFALLLLYVT